jgi:predicted esterase
MSPRNARKYGFDLPRTRLELQAATGTLLLAALYACGSPPAEEAEAAAAADPSAESAPASVDRASSGSGGRSYRTIGRRPTSSSVEEPSANPIPLQGNAPGPVSSEPAPASSGSAGAIEPILPEVSGDCPSFTTGTQTILGLSTEVVAGVPGDVKGPLLFTWHGTGGNGRQALRQLPQSVRDDIVAQGGIIIAPSDNGQVRAGRDVTFVLGVWYDGADLAFADQIVACAVQNHNIDPRRIFVTGCSAGGLMAGVMSVERSDYVAAVAPNSGGLATGQFQLQNADRVPAVMSMYGGDSDTVVVNFGDTTRTLTNVLKPKGSFVVECNHGMGHCGAPVSLHERAWEFMKAHPFGTKPSPFAGGLPGSFPAFCAIE